MTSANDLNRAHHLRKVCLHEHGHAAVARHFGVSGWVEITEYKEGELRHWTTPFFNGHFWHDRIKSRPVRRIVGLAGIAAELLDSEPNITAEGIELRLNSGAVILSESDEEMIGNVTSQTRYIALGQCMGLVRAMWHEITKAAEADAVNLLGG